MLKEAAKPCGGGRGGFGGWAADLCAGGQKTHGVCRREEAGLAQGPLRDSWSVQPDGGGLRGLDGSSPALKVVPKGGGGAEQAGTATALSDSYS